MPSVGCSLRQVFINFEDDANFRWHHRILLHHVEAAFWIVSTPDKRVERTNLGVHRVVVLGRNSPFPADRVGDSYVCDLADFGPGELARLAVEAKTMAEIFAGPARGAPQAAADQPASQV